MRATGLGKLPTLTVLAYHRICDAADPGFVGLRWNVSATQAEFERQMRLVRSVLHPVSLDEAVDAIAQDKPLPSGAVLVTFDDGYRDNLTAAMPVLRDLGIPAVIFLATDHIGTGRPFWWDVAAHGFDTTSAEQADLPLLGRVALGDAPTRRAVADRWLAQAKGRHGYALDRLAREVCAALGVDADAPQLSRLQLDWDEVLQLAANGFALGGHTVRHTIVARLDPDEARHEMQASRDAIAARTDLPVRSFAFPNGGRRDFSCLHETLLEKVGYEVAFSLLWGPTTLAEARRKPMAVRRICIDSRDSMAGFAAKLMGSARLRAALARA